MPDDDSFMNKRLLKGKEVCAMVGGVDRSTIWRWQKECGFPEPLVLNQHSTHTHVAWRLEDVEAWIASRQRGGGCPVPRPQHARKPIPLRHRPSVEA